MSPRPRFHRLEPDKKAAILQAAALEFAEHGYEDASLNRIIESAGISKGAMYYYFDDKADLYATCARDLIASSLASLDWNVRVEDADAFWARIGELFDGAIEKTVEDPMVFAFGRSFVKTPAALREHPGVVEFLDEIQQYMRQILEEGQRVGAVRTDLPLALLIRVLFVVDEAMDTFFYEAIERGDPVDFASLVPMYVDMQRRIVAPEYPTEKKP
ncbi:MAG: TetR/AcrR family transcriptional regulator [Phycisphaerales bacterium]|nr:TetR/AcrR family transcriptional regulator [Phycisphaerales bacterium]